MSSTRFSEPPIPMGCITALFFLPASIFYRLRNVARKVLHRDVSPYGVSSNEGTRPSSRCIFIKAK